MNKLLTGYFAVRKIHDEYLKDLLVETDRIVKIITRFFGKKDSWWAYGYYEDEREDAPFPRMTGGNFQIYISEECDSGKWYYNESIPVAFFDMTDKQILEYLKNEVAEHKKEEEIKNRKTKESSEKKKLKKETIKKSALKKLTTEERKALDL